MSQDCATVDGQKVHKSDFGYAPGDEPSRWKFPLHDQHHVESALKMYSHAKDIPAEGMAALKRKIIERAHKFGVDPAKVERFEQRTESASEILRSAQDGRRRAQDSGFGTRASGRQSSIDNRQLPIVDCRLTILLTNEGVAVDTPSGVTMQRPGAQLREIAVAVPGTWVKGDHSFSITKQDLAAMERNFEKRKNDMIVIDYEHASEQPEVARGGPVPGAGWIHDLRLEARDLGLAAGGSGLGGNGKPPASSLKALVEWTPQAEEMLRTGQYRFFSPAIDWGAKDKETGEPQGATLTSGALTNHPFLEELPPIMLSDGTLIGTRDLKLEAGKPLASSLKQLEKGATRMAEENREQLTDPETLADKGGHALPMLKVSKGKAGSAYAGHHVFSDGDQEVGCMSDEDLRKHLGVNPDAEKASEISKLILSEVAKDGRVNNQRASELAVESKITLADYIRAQEAEKLIEGAVQAGKILPRDRSFFFRDALERPAEFAEYVKGAPQAVKLGVRGFGEAETMTPDQEVAATTKKLIEEKKLQYPAALKQVLTENPGLADRYRAAHSSRVNADGTAN